jgi:hypothetical protein
MDRLIFTFKGNQNLLKQRRMSRALPPSVLGSCVSLLKSYDFVRETLEILGTYDSDASLETIGFSVGTYNRFLSSVHKAFTSEKTLSPAAFVPGRDKENPPVDDDTATTNNPGYIIFYDDNIKYQG